MPNSQFGMAVTSGEAGEEGRGPGGKLKGPQRSPYNVLLFKLCARYMAVHYIIDYVIWMVKMVFHQSRGKIGGVLDQDFCHSLLVVWLWAMDKGLHLLAPSSDL